MAEYQLIKDSDTILRRIDNAFIPNDPANRDRYEYEQWLAEGNEPDQPDPPPTVEQPPPIPSDPDPSLGPEQELKLKGKT